MKLQELFLTQEDFEKKRQAKAGELKRKIEDNQVPEIHNASGVMSGYAWGDLEQLGWAERESEPGVDQFHVRQRWVYNGPNPIKLLTKYAKVQDGEVDRGVNTILMQPGDATNWVDVDVS